MVHRKAAFGHHFFQISVAQRVAQVPTNASENNLGLVMSPLEQIGYAVASVYVDFSWVRCTLLEVETLCNRAYPGMATATTEDLPLAA